MESEDRSPEMVRLVYFLHRYARTDPKGRYRPPAEFGDLNKREVYQQFFPLLGGSRPFKRFQNSAEGLRNGNIREHLDEGVPYLTKYESILSSWQHLTCEQQWEYLQQYRTV